MKGGIKMAMRGWKNLRWFFSACASGDDVEKSFGRFFSWGCWTPHFMSIIFRADGQRKKRNKFVAAAQSSAHMFPNYHKKSSRRECEMSLISQSKSSFFPPLVFNLLSFRPLERSFGTYEINYAKRENATMEIGSWNHGNGQISVSHHPAHNDDEISMSWTQISVCKTEQKISLALISSLYFEARFISLNVLESESSWIVLMILWWMKKRIYASSRVMLWALRERWFKSRLLMMLDPSMLMMLWRP